MKISSLAGAFVLTVASVQAMPAANNYCHHPGEICTKLKRDAEINLRNEFCDQNDELCDKFKIKREASPGGGAYCHHPGEICTKLKRDAELEARSSFCNGSGEICAKVKRAAAFIDDLAVEA